MVHEAVAGKLDTLKPDWDVNVIEPGGKKKHQLIMMKSNDSCIIPGSENQVREWERSSKAT